MEIQKLHENYVIELKMKIIKFGVSGSSRKIGCSRSYISRILNGKQIPSIKTVEKMLLSLL